MHPSRFFLNPENAPYEGGSVMKLKQGLVFAFILICLPLSASSEETRYAVPVGDSPSLGPENAPVTIIEFIDFQ